jgi:hypothetical protein
MRGRRVSCAGHVQAMHTELQSWEAGLQRLTGMQRKCIACGDMQRRSAWGASAAGRARAHAVQHVGGRRQQLRQRSSF